MKGWASSVLKRTLPSIVPASSSFQARFQSLVGLLMKIEATFCASLKKRALRLTEVVHLLTDVNDCPPEQIIVSGSI